MQLLIQFTVRVCACSEYISFLFICCGLDCSFLLPMSCSVYLFVFLVSVWLCTHSDVRVCTHQHQSTCVCMCVVTVHASLWDTLISAHCGSAPSCPCGWLLIETNQACDGPIAVTPHPSHPRPNHLLIGPRRAPSRWHGRLIWPVDEGSRRE